MYVGTTKEVFDMLVPEEVCFPYEAVARYRDGTLARGTFLITKGLIYAGEGRCPCFQDAQAVYAISGTGPERRRVGG